MGLEWLRAKLLGAVILQTRTTTARRTEKQRLAWPERYAQVDYEHASGIRLAVKGAAESSVSSCFGPVYFSPAGQAMPEEQDLTERNRSR